MAKGTTWKDRRWLIAGAAAAIGLVGYLTATHLPTSHNRSATLAPASVFLATTGVDTNACSSTAPCLTMNRGYKAAQLGQVVEMAGGTYAAQTVTNDPSKASGSGQVTFAAASGQLVIVKGLILDGARNITVQGNSPNSNLTRVGALLPPTSGITLSPTPDVSDSGYGFAASNCADNVSLLQVDTGPGDVVNDATGFTWDGGSFGGTTAGLDGIDIGGPYLGRTKTYCPTAKVPGAHLTHLAIHDILRTTNPAAHDDCIQLLGAQGVTVDYNAFARCGTSDLLARPNLGICACDVIDNVTIIHNLISPPPEGGNVIAMGASTDTIGNATISDNTCGPSVGCITNLGATFASLHIDGNWWAYMASFACSQWKAKSTTWDGNQYATGQFLCGTNATTVATPPDPFAGDPTVSTVTVTIPDPTVTVATTVSQTVTGPTQTMTGPTVTETTTVTAQVPGDAGCTPNCDAQAAQAQADLVASSAQVASLTVDLAAATAAGASAAAQVTALTAELAHANAELSSARAKIEAAKQALG